MKPIAVALSLLLAGLPKHGQASPLVVELFTSQACSSCPPADVLLSRLKETRPDLLVLDFHVDYWNNLGWRDPFSSPVATARQYWYDRALHLGEVYTPQMVIAGGHEAIGSDTASVKAAIDAELAAASRRPAVAVSLVRHDGHLTLSVGGGRGAALLWLVGYDDHHRTSVGGGENGGRTLDEVNMVRAIMPAGRWDGQAVTRDAAVPPGEQFALLVQQDDGLILAAAIAP
jgi:hypothetical protein